MKTTYTAGGDLGLRSDSSACAIVGRKGNRYECIEMLELQPKPGAPLVPSQVCASFAALLHKYRIQWISLDHHYVESAREHFAAQGISVVTTSPSQDAKVSSYIMLRTIINDGRIRLLDGPRLVAQLKSIQSRAMPGGGMTISAPRKAGVGHGDLVSALVLAVSAAACPPQFTQRNFRWLPEA